MLIKGIGWWCKICGSPHPNKFKNGARQWSFDLSVDKDTQKKLLDAGMRPSYLKDKQDDRGVFISFVRDELKVDGTPGKTFKIVDHHNEPWPQDKLIGNGSTLNVAIVLSERTYRGEKFLKPSCVAIQCWNFVPYERKSDFPSKEDAVAVATGEAKEW